MPKIHSTKTLLAFLYLAVGLAAQATLPVPDHLIYGEIYIGTNLVTGFDTNVVVELRRDSLGPAISRYRLGDNPNLGDFYSINVPLEQVDPASTVQPGLVNAHASVPGDALYLVVLDHDLLLYQSNIMAQASSSVQRLDFGGPSLIDAWQLTYLGMTGVDMTGDPFGKGNSLMDDYVAGTDPADFNDRFTLNIENLGPGATVNDLVVSFFGVRAEGPGYDGLSRFYALEYTTNLGSIWLGIPNYTNVPGNNFPILFMELNPEINRAYRARVWLDDSP